MTLRRPRISTVIILLLVSFIAWFALYPLDQRPASGLSSWTDPPPGKRVDIGGYRLHLHCQGEARTGQPAVVLEAGAGSDSRSWRVVQEALAGETVVCAYDRAGYAWSDPGPQPRTAKQMASELHTLLTNAGIAPPYILAAHSFGGFPARRFAINYPQDTAGLVLVDPTDETMHFLVPVTAIMAVGLRFDALNTAFNRPADERWQASQHTSSALSAELIALPITIRQTKIEPEQLNGLPLVVISASLDPEPDQVTMSQRDVMTRWSGNSQYVHANCGHAVHHEQPKIVVQAIRSLLDPLPNEPFSLRENRTIDE